MHISQYLEVIDTVGRGFIPRPALVSKSGDNFTDDTRSFKIQKSLISGFMLHYVYKAQSGTKHLSFFIKSNLAKIFKPGTAFTLWELLYSLSLRAVKYLGF